MVIKTFRAFIELKNSGKKISLKKAIKACKNKKLRLSETVQFEINLIKSKNERRQRYFKFVYEQIFESVFLFL